MLQTVILSPDEYLHAQNMEINLKKPQILRCLI